MSHFSERLREHEANGGLRGAWDDFVLRTRHELQHPAAVVHQHDTYTGARSTRTRWLKDETRPSCRACVEALAAVLEDPAIVAAWSADGAEHGERRLFNDTATRVGQLPVYLKLALVEQLRLELQQSEFSTRESVSIVVRITPFTSALHRGLVTVRWRGTIPARAKVRVASDRESLNAAFDDRSCVYRDLVHLSKDELEKGYAELAAVDPSRPIVKLDFKRQGERTWTELNAASVGDGAPGCFELANDSVDDAEIRLKVMVPCPTQYACYPIQFGSYRVRGVAKLSLKLAKEVTREKPNMLVFPPDCAISDDDDDDDDDGATSIELGEKNSLLPAATTIVFYWAQPHLPQDPAGELS